MMMMMMMMGMVIMICWDKTPGIIVSVHTSTTYDVNHASPRKIRKCLTWKSHNLLEPQLTVTWGNVPSINGYE